MKKSSKDPLQALPGVGPAMAADFRLPGSNAYGVARIAAEMQVGGVGLYRRDGFVHLDCGPPRRW